MIINHAHDIKFQQQEWDKINFQGFANTTESQKGIGADRL